MESCLRGRSSCHPADNLVSRHPRKVACSDIPLAMSGTCGMQGSRSVSRFEYLLSQMLRLKPVCVRPCFQGESLVLPRLTLFLLPLVLVLGSDCFYPPLLPASILYVWCVYVCVGCECLCICPGQRRTPGPTLSASTLFL